MATQTPNLGLNKSADGEFGWGTQLRQNQDILDSAIGALRVSTPAGANVQLTPTANSIPLANPAGEVARGWMPQGLKRVSTYLTTDYALQTWSDALEDGHYDVSLTVAQNGLPSGYWYIDVQRYDADYVANQWRTITAKSFGSGNTPNQIYTATCFSGSWTPFRRVAVDEPLTWVTPTFVNGWSDYGSAFVCKYAKDSSGTVFLKGVIKGGSNIANTTAFTYPVGMRPSSITEGIASVQGGYVGWSLNPTGALAIYGGLIHTGNATTFTRLTIAFKAEQ